MNSNHTGPRQRALATGLYLGLVPLILPERTSRASASYVAHHGRQAGALFACLFVLVALLAASALALTFLLIYHRDFYQDYHLERHVLGVLRKLVLAWAVYWAFGIGQALLGSQRPLPLLGRIARRSWCWRSGAWLVLASYVSALALTPIALHAQSLTPADRTSGDVHILYDDNNTFPRWFFLLSFYPMIRTASDLWGPESVVLGDFERSAAIRAAGEATVIYLGTHGTPKGLMLEDSWLTPDDLAEAADNPRLQFVYLSGCDSGQQRDGWLKAFAPAEVVTYDRLSAVLEHAYWLWFRAPDKLRAIYEEETS